MAAEFAKRGNFSNVKPSPVFMKHFLRPVIFLAAVLLLAGCNTFERRAKERATVYNALDAATQENLKAGRVELGYTMDMVYIALGNPDQKKDQLTPKGRTTTWIYNSYYQEYVGTAHVGYRRYAVYNPKTRSYAVFVEPVYSNVYRDRVEPKIRISFKDGRVSAIEQVKG